MKQIKTELPDWMKQEEKIMRHDTQNALLLKNAAKLTDFLKTFVDSAESGRNFTVNNFINLILTIFFLSISDSVNFTWIMLLCNLIFIYNLPVKMIKKIFKHTSVAMCSVMIVMAPIFFINPQNASFIFVFKTVVITFIIISRLTGLNLNSIINVLRKFRFPSFLVFIITMMILYLKVLAVLLSETLSAVMLRGFGKLKQPYYTIGSIFGGLYLTSIQLSNQVYEAMVARCFDGNYSLGVKKSKKDETVKTVVINLAICLLFILI
ncbi:energy-coupling factor transporter transmembrane component T family protein [Companilactobacillus muriivasis]|uniref:energy-coupling factor transporter transmembrane component T family protein n=1 Tax=Companilactobacillus muriivasis TaxID=3081444 RepID=UPI0030C6DD24